MDYDFNLFYYINIYKKCWKKIVLVMLISMFLTACFSLLMPPTYISTATVLTAETGGASGPLGRFFSDIPGLTIGSSSNEVILSILRSRRMAKDITEHFELSKKPRFSYSISDRRVAGGLAIDVRGTDPAFVQKIADFVIANLDKINTELDITPNKPMVKVLDPATYGARQSRQIARKILVAGLLAFLVTSIYIFFLDYLKKIKTSPIA